MTGVLDPYPVDDGVTQSAVQPTVEASVLLSGARLLIVEEHIEGARQLAAALRKELPNCSVQTAFSGQETVELLREQRFDVVLLDLELSGMPGMEVLRYLRTLPCPPEVVVMSAQLSIAVAVAAVQAGARDVVEKPVELSSVVQRLKRVVYRVHAHSAVAVRASRTGAEHLLLGVNPAIVALRAELLRLARFPDVSVLIVGETGTGKEVVATALHRISRPDSPLVCLNCAALPEQLFESELFGHARGAFTGAGERVGLMEATGDGTLFLDEVGELPAALQAKLLRALEQRRFRRLGSSEERPFRGRIISATNRDLAEEGSTLRADLFYRLAGFTVVTPPLRERLEDVPMLAEHFLSQFAARYGTAPLELADDALALLREWDWPGNVRELRAVMDQAAMLALDGVVGAAELRPVLRRHKATMRVQRTGRTSDIISSTATLPEIEREAIEFTLARHQGNVSRAALALGIPRSTLRDKLRRLGRGGNGRGVG